MGVLSIVGQLILSLSILVTLHECGHFFPAKWFKTKVEKFYLFFNPGFSLYKKQIGETEYGIGWVPFGGYVKIAGMIDESMDTEQMKKPPQPWEFRSKPAWQRLIIMIGGVTVNFILGFLIYAGLFWYYGVSYIKSDDVTMGIAVTELGEKLGLEDGDKILAIDDVPFDRFEPSKLVQEIVINTPQVLSVERAGRKTRIPIPAGMVGELTKHENKGKGLFTYRLPQKVVAVKKGSIADKMGLQQDDQILSVNGTSTYWLHDFAAATADNQPGEYTFQVWRNKKDTVTLSATLPEGQTAFGFNNALADHYYPEQRDKYTLMEAIPAGVNKGVGFLTSQIKAFGKMANNEIKATEGLGSIVSIATMFDKSWNWERFWQITAMLSILLAFFNLLPIPALDGGYVLFLLFEVITGKKPNDKFMEYATMIGFFLLIGLMIFALGLDFSRLFKC